MSQSAFGLLSHGVQGAVFRLGWSELRPIQVEAIQILRSNPNADLIISAPTAGGKTEAAFLPILSHLDENPADTVIYVSPLKALINDQWRRLDSLCEAIDIPVRRWHGDVYATEKRSFRENPRGVLLITPESLESNFINYGQSLSSIYARTAYVVIDEIHTFVDNVRGIHLRSLIARLCAVAKYKPRFVGLSATLGNPDAAKAFLRPDEQDRVHLIAEELAGKETRIGLRAYTERPRFQKGEILTRRLSPKDAGNLILGIHGDPWKSPAPLTAKEIEKEPLEPDASESPRDALDDIADDLSAHFQVGTNLVFGNSRRTLEELADILHERAKTEKWNHDPFCVHHGSLSKSLREEVEERLKGRIPCTVLCTSTLELGIDIGNVRTIGQIDPPWSIAALIQRLGRSGRRDGDVRRMRLYTRDETPHIDSSLDNLLFPNLLRSIAIVQLMLEKWIEPSGTTASHLSTLVHQILSILRQTGGTPATELFSTLCQQGPFRCVSQNLFARVLRSLGEKETIEQMPSGDIILAPQGEYIVNAHDFYAAFVSNELFSVRHQEHVVGEITADDVPSPGEAFILGGRRWEVEEISPRQKAVWVIPTRKRIPPRFTGDGGDIHTRIFEKIRDLLLSDAMPVFLDSDARTLLACARHAARESGAADTGIVVRARSISWYPWTGTKAFRTLSLMLRLKKIRHDVSSLSISFPVTQPNELEDIFYRLRNEPMDATELSAQMQIKTFDKFDTFLSEDILNEINAKDRLDTKGALKALETASAAWSH